MTTTTIQVTDPTAAPTYAPTAFQRFIESLVFDPRDAVFVRLWLRSLLLVAPVIGLMYWRFSWWLAPVVFLFQVAWMTPPVILMLHNTMHRPFFKRWRLMNRIVPYSMSALFGIPTGYMEHHVGMHHQENNLRADLSSTMRYQRDSFLHWLVYLARFLFLSHVELTSYLVKKHRQAFAIRAMASDAVHILCMIGLWTVHWQATLVCFVIPYFTVRFAMMAGNWGQHAFLDPTRPGDSYVNSITCINAAYNARCFNDGYHIGHHVKQNRHWTELPQDFLDNLERYRKEGCVVFHGVDFFMVSVLLWTKQYRFLAKRFVRMPGDTRTDDEIVDFLKSRTRAIPDDVPEGVVMNA
jgi:fatty acid desaturase